MKGLVGTASRGVRPCSNLCSVCSKILLTATEKETIVCFQCGHSFHYLCLVDAGAAEETPQGRERKWKCCTCDRHHRPGTKAHHRKKSSESSAFASNRIAANPTQVLAFENVRRMLRSPSRLQTLLDLKGPGRERCNPFLQVQNERQKLRLSAPPPPWVRIGTMNGLIGWSFVRKEQSTWCYWPNCSFLSDFVDFFSAEWERTKTYQFCFSFGSSFK